jgi:hypothetical protein
MPRSTPGSKGTWNAAARLAIRDEILAGLKLILDEKQAPERQAGGRAPISGALQSSHR